MENIMTRLYFYANESLRLISYYLRYYSYFRKHLRNNKSPEGIYSNSQRGVMEMKMKSRGQYHQQVTISCVFLGMSTSIVVQLFSYLTFRCVRVSERAMNHRMSYDKASLFPKRRRKLKCTITF